MKAEFLFHCSKQTIKLAKSAIILYFICNINTISLLFTFVLYQILFSRELLTASYLLILYHQTTADIDIDMHRFTDTTSERGTLHLHWYTLIKVSSVYNHFTSLILLSCVCVKFSSHTLHLTSVQINLIQLTRLCYKQ